MDINDKSGHKDFFNILGNDSSPGSPVSEKIRPLVLETLSAIADASVRARHAVHTDDKDLLYELESIKILAKQIRGMLSN